MQKFKDIPYARPDYAALEREIEGYARALAEAKRYKEARALFLGNEERLQAANTMYTVAYIRNTCNMQDEFYAGEMDYFYEEGPKMDLCAMKADKVLLSSPFLKDFEREFGSRFLREKEAQQRLTDESILAEKTEEGKLCQQYSKAAGSATTLFRGEECNFYGLLRHMLSTDREERKEAFLAWAALYEKISGELDGIFDRLVSLRKRMAEKLGFGSYIEMAYLANGHFDYGKEEIASFRRQVAEDVVPVAAALYEEQRERLGIDKLHFYDESLVFPDGNAQPCGGREELVAAAGRMYRALSPETDEFFRFMTEHELFDLETRPGKHMGGYCTFLFDWKAPFIFSNFNGSSADVDVLTHEAGHAFQSYTASRTLPLPSLTWATSDISEIHSMSMEFFAYPYMEGFFGENADKYRYAHLTDTVKTLSYLCLVDHFQEEVYESGLDAAGRRAAWKRLEKLYLPWRDYDGNPFLEGGGFWMQKQHIFLYPFYYVDYALAQLGAFEFHTREQTAAWRDYCRLCRAGGSKGYFELLKEGGLSNPFEAGTVKRIISQISLQAKKFREG